MLKRKRKNNTNLLILESVDNCGKGHLINAIIEKSTKPIYVIHFTNPKSHNTKSIKQIIDAQYIDFDLKFKQAIELIKLGYNVIFDRSHLGELVYAPIYRQNTGEWVLKLEKKYKKLIKHTALFTMYMDINFLIKHDDGLSFSIEPNDKIYEIALFKSAHKDSKITNKIYYNNFDDTTKYYKNTEDTLNVIKKLVDWYE